MSSFPAYGTSPSNPDARPLPDGWITQFDPNYQAWFYVNTRVQPPVITWEHPSGPPSAGPPSFPSHASPHADSGGGFRFPQAMQSSSMETSSPYNQPYAQSSPQPGFPGSSAQPGYAQPPHQSSYAQSPANNAAAAPPSYDQSGKPQSDHADGEKGMASKLATAAIAGKMGSKLGFLGGGKNSSGSSSGGGLGGKLGGLLGGGGSHGGHSSGGGLGGKLGGLLGGGGSHGGHQGGYGGYGHSAPQHGGYAPHGYGAPQQMFAQHGKPHKKKGGGMGGAGLAMGAGAGILGGVLLADALDDDMGGFGDDMGGDW